MGGSWEPWAGMHDFQYHDEARFALEAEATRLIMEFADFISINFGPR